MKKVSLLIYLNIKILFLTNSSFSQNIITFDTQGWSSDQSLPQDFIIGDFKFSSSDKLFTNYGYNFNISNTSIYFFFRNPTTDKITITILDNKPVKIKSIATYQVSETGIDSLIIEGWNGAVKKYTLMFSNIIRWQPAVLNYSEVNKVVIKSGNTSNNRTFDYNFDNIHLEYDQPFVRVELLSFNVIVKDQDVTLTWSIVPELNNQGFEVQRRFVNNDFLTIGSVKEHGMINSPNNYTYTDKLIDAGKYFYRLKWMDYGGNYLYSEEVEVSFSPFTTYKLEQNYPNPYNSATTIGFAIQENENVRLSVLNILGEEIKILLNEEKEAGYHSIELNTSDLPSGVYFYRIHVGNFIETKKMILLK